jgi:SAM-dependent methyltransferase
MPSEFDRYAKDYDSLLRDPLRDRFTQNSKFFYVRKWILIQEFLERRRFAAASSAWLDVGCGRGELLVLGQRHFARVAGCEPSEQMASSATVEVSHQPSPDVLPFPNESFDFVTAVCVYHHVEEEDRRPLTREIQRVLRPGGIFSIIEHNPLNPVTRIIVSRAPVDQDAHLLTARRARQYLRSAGFLIIGLTYFLYLPEKLFHKSSRLERLLARVPLGGQYAIFGQKPSS